MIEIIWIGRGGQGAFTAAKLFGAAYALKGDNYHALSFPSFGPERRGAPVRAFSKLDDKPISDRSQTKKADYIVILDDTLYSEGLKNMLKPNGKIIINSKSFNEQDAIVYNAKVLASDLRLPTVNTIMMGVMAKVSRLVDTQDLFGAIDEYMQEKIRSKNKEAISKVLKEA